MPKHVGTKQALTFQLLPHLQVAQAPRHKFKPAISWREEQSMKDIEANIRTLHPEAGDLLALRSKSVLSAAQREVFHSAGAPTTVH